MTMRAIFMGTPDFAVPSLRAVVENGWEVLVVTQPDRKVGRKRALTPPPVKTAAMKLELAVMQPERIRDEHVVAELADFGADILITAAYGQILPKSVLCLPRTGSVNVHASLLPRWRGAAPIHRAIMAGDAETGVTLMEMVSKLDAGPMIDTRRTPIYDNDNVATVHDRVAYLGGELIHDVLPRYVSGEIKATPQPEDGITYAAKIEREDEFVDWTQSSMEIHRHIRGVTPWPGATTQMDSGDWVKVWGVSVPVSSHRLTPGSVEKVGSDILVGTGDGALCLTDIQVAGKRRMAASDWFSGLQSPRVHFRITVSGEME